MGPILYVMAILGCGEAEASCQQVDVASAQYQTIDACNAATAEEVERRLDLAYPVVVAQCHEANRKLSAAELNPADIGLPEPEVLPAVAPARSDPQSIRLARR